jgi:hypothetical protein
MERNLNMVNGDAAISHPLLMEEDRAWRVEPDQQGDTRREAGSAAAGNESRHEISGRLNLAKTIPGMSDRACFPIDARWLLGR